MGYEGQDFSEIAGGVSPAFVETLYKRSRNRRTRSSRRGAAGSRAGERAVGRELGEPAWPPTTTDDLTAALDPTQMEPAAKPPRAPRPPPPPSRVAGRHPQGRERFDPRDDADPHLSRARAPRRQSRSARPSTSTNCRPTSRPNITASPAPTSTGRSISAAARAANGRRSASWSTSCARIIAATSASNTCTSPTSRSAASCRTGWRARTRRSASPPTARRRS